MTSEPETALPSVVIATHNRRLILARTLAALESQSVRDFRIVVVDDGSSDGTYEWLATRPARATGPQLVVDRQENRGQGPARNRGLERVEDGLVIFLGDDVVPRPGFVAAHLAAHRRLESGSRDGGRHAVVGFTDWDREAVRVTPLLEMIQRDGHQFGFGRMTPGGEVPFTCFYTSNVSLPRRALGDHPFDPAFTAYGWEDVELGYRLTRAGLRLFFEPAAAAEHLHPMDLPFVLERQRQVGRGLLSLLELHPELAASPHLSSPRPPAWQPVARWLVPPLVPLLHLLDRWRLPLPRALLHRVLLCSYYRGVAEASR